MNDRAALGWLLGLCALTGLLALVHSARFVCLRYGLDGGLLMHPAFSLETDGGFAETFNYLQTLALVGLLLRLAAHRRAPVYLAWAVAFAAVLLDDVLAINQALGDLLAHALALPGGFGLKAQDQAELLVYALGAALIGAGVHAAFRRSDPGARRDGLMLGATFLLLMLCAIGLDLLHIKLIRAFFGSRLLLEVLEDGGEMVAISVALTLVLALGRPPRAA